MLLLLQFTGARKKFFIFILKKVLEGGARVWSFFVVLIPWDEKGGREPVQLKTVRRTEASAAQKHKNTNGWNEPPPSSKITRHTVLGPQQGFGYSAFVLMHDKIMKLWIVHEYFSSCISGFTYITHITLRIKH